VPVKPVALVKSVKFVESVEPELARLMQKDSSVQEESTSRKRKNMSGGRQESFHDNEPLARESWYLRTCIVTNVHPEFSKHDLLDMIQAELGYLPGNNMTT
jgi:hypothetical protein